MPIEVVFRESEDDFEVFSAGGTLGPDGPSELFQDLNEILDQGGSNRQILMNIAGRLIDVYPGVEWTIKVERYDGYTYWLRFDIGVGNSLASNPIKRISRYERDPVI
jgi:hypothetical protein